MLRFYEGSFFGSTGLPKVQDHQAPGGGSSNLRESEAQAKTGLKPAISGWWLMASHEQRLLEAEV